MCQGSHSLAGKKDVGLNKSYREKNSPPPQCFVCVCVCVCVCCRPRESSKEGYMNWSTPKCSPENTDDKMSAKYENKKWIDFCAQGPWK